MALTARTISNGPAQDNTALALAVWTDSGSDIQAAVPTDKSGNEIKFKGSTATRTQVADTASDTLILAANSARVSASIANDSSAVLYLALGTVAASATDYTAKVFTNDLYEVPFGYTGPIRGIWSSDPGDGAARVTEVT